jgi:predicted nucleic acid-binding protein
VIILDTCVVSELLRVDPDTQVLRWYEAESDDMVLSAVTAAELLAGVEALPEGRRRTRLARLIDEVIERFGGRAPVFDITAARAYGRIIGERRGAGRPISVADAMIAAICEVHSAALATRNIKDFQGLDLRLVNPWSG